MNRSARLLVGSVATAFVATIAWAAFTPVPMATNREHVFAIPAGTWARRMAGEHVEILPARIRLTLGIDNVLRLENHDRVPQVFGPTMLMPGQTFRLPFERASENSFACSAHASGQMTIVVDPFPGSPWHRLRWRAQRLVDSLQPHPSHKHQA